MAEIIINDVKYTNVPNKKAGTKFASALTQSNIGMSQAVQDYVNSSYFYALINAIDINWDGIDIGENSYINTTSDLIKWIETKAGDIDLSSYATVTYVNQKIEDLVGAAPETLDTLGEIAAALQNDATLSYVTEALSSKANTADVYDKTTVDNMIGELDSTYASISYVTTELEKKADISDIPSAPDLTPYVTYTQANSYYAGKNEIPDMTDYATVSYVTTELENKADISDIPSAPDLTPYVTYTQANSYYAPNTDHIFHRLENSNGTDIAYLKRSGHYNNLSDIIYKIYSKNNYGILGKSHELLILSSLYSDNNKRISIGGDNSIIGGGEMNTNGISYTYLSNGIFIGKESEIGQKYNSDNQYTIHSGLFIGDNIVSNRNYQYILGIYNTISDDSSKPDYNFDSNTTMFAIGNGSRSSRHNAFEVRRNGYVYIADSVNGEPYVLQNRLVDKANIDLLKNVTITDVQNGQILSYNGTEWVNTNMGAQDLTNYVSYTQANSYYVTVEGTKQLIYGPKTFIGDKRINFRQGTSTDKLGFTLYNANEKEVGGLEWRPDTIDGRSLLSLQQYIGTGKKFEGVDMGYLGFRLTDRAYKYNLVTPLPSFVNTIETINVGDDYKNFFFPLAFQNGDNKVYTECTGLVDLSTLIPSAPDLTPYVTYADANTYYVDVTSYNTLYAEVQHLAYLISYYHPEPTPAPGLLTPTVDWIDSNTQMSVGNSIALDKSDLDVSLTFNGTPSTGWTFTDPAGLTGIVQSDGAIYVNPQTLGEGTYSVGVYYPGDSTYDTLTTSFDITITDNSQGPDPGPTPSEPPTVDDWFIDGTTVGSNYATYTEDDSTSHVLTFGATPAGWTITDPNVSGVVVDNVGLTVTFTPSLMSTGQCNINVERESDGAYGYGSGTFTINITSGDDHQ